jgi:hypothetical protein
MERSVSPEPAKTETITSSDINAITTNKLIVNSPFEAVQLKAVGSFCFSDDICFPRYKCELTGLGLSDT